MKFLVILLSVGAMASGPALAGGPAVIAEDPVIVAAPSVAAVHDWSGAYAGLSYGTASADLQYPQIGLTYDLDGGSVAGLHAGYLFQSGSFVYGGELAYGVVSDLPVPGFETEDGIDRVIDLKARGGYAVNRALFYGVVGYSRSPVTADSAKAKMDGVSVGIGAEFAMSERLSVGLEYLSRDVSGIPDQSTIVSEASVNTFSLRVGISF